MTSVSYKGQFHILVAFHRHPIVKTFNVKDHEFCIWGGKCAIEEAFCGGEASTGRGGDSGIIQAIAADGGRDGFHLSWDGWWRQAGHR